METTLAVLDVREKETGSQVRPPAFPTPKPNGFPEHKKRTRVSAFKRQKQQEQSGATPSSGHGTSEPSLTLGSQGGDGSSNDQDRPHFDSERRRIDKENRERLAAMSAEDIAEAQNEILQLDPSLIQMLLRRANLDEKPAGPDPFATDNSAETTAGKSDATGQVPTPPKFTPSNKPEEEIPGDPKGAITENKAPTPKKKTVSFAPTVEDDEPDAESTPLSDIPEQALATNTTHFPHPANPPDLDPADPNFLETLHSKYFPNLPADPARLAWMAPVPTEDSPADRESPYYPGQTSLAVSQLRFDFQGRLLPPRVSRKIPVSLGLHHHGEAPEAAGYTVGELARLARSAVPAQRCIAFQTLGRILFRLGKGEWGVGEGTMGMGIFRCVSEGRVLDSLKEAAAVEEGVGHRSSRAYAIEALWLYEKGGWTKSFKGR
ncbi:hypothetical protein MCOR25_001257 [Pyricularia grisea]|uniref:RNA polymerase II-associated protein RBA50 n=1 Tax=Pyricularia grisea TaxID=148305 RepID=A0A6P8BGM1_PYRGI|nr:uncharacterized protein PgNI_00737 [Pyricularia grisea]KAI6381325.1 hypothetical protein MCOR25_001257 [Pyricularia grisea]TLD15812.1 hypothetical protein PgNI_00737 [Pyricularia grisea]